MHDVILRDIFGLCDTIPEAVKGWGWKGHGNGEAAGISINKVYSAMLRADKEEGQDGE